MICFGAKTDQEVKERVTYGFHTNKLKKKRRRIRIEQADERREIKFYFILFYFLSLLSSIYGNQTVRIRRGKKQSALLNDGYAWEPKTWDFAEFLIKIRKILCFGFSQIYGFLPVRIGRSRRSN